LALTPLARLFPVFLITLSFILPVFLPGAARAADFKAGITVRKGSTPVSGYVFISGEKARMDMYGPEGTVITISRPDKGLTWLVNVPRKEYLEVRGLAVNPLGWRTPQEWDKLAEKKSLGTETVEGYLCDKTLYTFIDKSKGVVMEWTAQKLKYTIKSIFYSASGLAVTELKKIEEELIEDIAFEIPEGYKKVGVSQTPDKAPKADKDK
jgi:hypothetical protein